MQELKTAVFATVLAAVATGANGAAVENMTGFVDVDRQLALEASLVKSLSATELDAWSKRLSAHAHHAGSPYGKKMFSLLRNSFDPGVIALK